MRPEPTGCSTYNLGQVERVIADGVEDEILEFVDGPKQVVAQRGHDRTGLLMADPSMEDAGQWRGGSIRRSCTAEGRL